MSSVTLKGNPVALEGKLPAVGSKAPDFCLVLKDLSEVSLASYEGKAKLLIAVPSIDTAVCAKESREFHVRLAGKDGLVSLVVSGDLPFAGGRFCAAEGIENLFTASQYRDMDFSRAYGTHIAEGPLRGLSARAVILLDKENVVRYVELVPEITEEPNYDAALAAVAALG